MLNENYSIEELNDLISDITESEFIDDNQQLEIIISAKKNNLRHKSGILEIFFGLMGHIEISGSEKENYTE